MDEKAQIRKTDLKLLEVGGEGNLPKTFGV